jgi:hypothetical protein
LGLAEEPERLLEAKEYRAAVIAAISLPEVYRRERLDVPSSVEGRRVTLKGLTIGNIKETLAGAEAT